MPAFKPTSWQRALTQAELYLEKQFKGQSCLAKADACLAAGVIAQIWRDHQVGIFQLQQKHIRHYLKYRLTESPWEDAMRTRQIIQDMLQVLGKDHWRY